MDEKLLIDNIMFKKLLDLFKNKNSQEITSKNKDTFDDDHMYKNLDRFYSFPKQHDEKIVAISRNAMNAFPRKVTDFKIRSQEGNYIEDSATGLKPSLYPYSYNNQGANPLLIEWYVNQGFIGYQNCALIAQHWLVDRCCTLPVKDAIRNGYFITNDAGDEIDPEVAFYIKKLDEKFGINNNLIQFYKKSAIFGIRIALFKVKSKDKNYYAKPFNIDSITPNSYEGIVQVDPYWITPELDMEAAGDPSSIEFYEPTYWNISGKIYHKSHLVITKYAELPDVLKPTYLYGGIPLTQMLYESVYNYERSLTEIPLLLQSKRLYVCKTNLDKLLTNPQKFEKASSILNFFKNNQGIFYQDRNDEMNQYDTSLSDIPDSINKLQQEIAAISGITETTLFSQHITGFNNTGEGDRSNYKEQKAEDAQRRILPLLNRHHEILIKSHVVPKFGKQSIIEASFNSPSSPDDKEVAEANRRQADIDCMYFDRGIVSGDEIRNRIINDEDSGYSLEGDESEKGFNMQTEYENEFNGENEFYKNAQFYNNEK